MNHPTHLLNSNEPNNFFKFLIGAVLFIGFILFLLSCFSPKEVTRTHTYKSEQHSDRIIITVDNSRRFDFKWNSGDTHSSYEDIFLDSKLDTGPAFTLVGIVLGVVVGFIRAIKIAGKVLTKK